MVTRASRSIADWECITAVPVLRIHEEHRQIAKMHWGLIPSWSKQPNASYSIMNARADTLATKPAFRTAFKLRRCLVLADGYYEWQAEGKVKQPYLYEVDGGEALRVRRPLGTMVG